MFLACSTLIEGRNSFILSQCLMELVQYSLRNMQFSEFCTSSCGWGRALMKMSSTAVGSVRPLVLKFKNKKWQKEGYCEFTMLQARNKSKVLRSKGKTMHYTWWQSNLISINCASSLEYEHRLSRGNSIFIHNNSQFFTFQCLLYCIAWC